jgi:hypothetical protein
MAGRATMAGPIAAAINIRIEGTLNSSNAGLKWRLQEPKFATRVARASYANRRDGAK